MWSSNSNIKPFYLVLHCILFYLPSINAQKPNFNDTVFDDAFTEYLPERTQIMTCVSNYLAFTTCQPNDLNCVCRESAPKLGGATGKLFSCIAKDQGQKEVLLVADYLDKILCKDVTEGACEQPPQLSKQKREADAEPNMASMAIQKRAVDPLPNSVLDSNLIPDARRCIAEYIEFTNCRLLNRNCVCNEVAPRLGRINSPFMTCIFKRTTGRLAVMDFLDNQLCADVQCGNKEDDGKGGVDGLGEKGGEKGGGRGGDKGSSSAEALRIPTGGLMAIFWAPAVGYWAGWL